MFQDHTTTSQASLAFTAATAPSMADARMPSCPICFLPLLSFIDYIAEFTSPKHTKVLETSSSQDKETHSKPKPHTMKQDGHKMHRMKLPPVPLTWKGTTVTRCEHVFHTECLNTWIYTSFRKAHPESGYADARTRTSHRSDGIQVRYPSSALSHASEPGLDRGSSHVHSSHSRNSESVAQASPHDHLNANEEYVQSDPGQGYNQLLAWALRAPDMLLSPEQGWGIDWLVDEEEEEAVPRIATCPVCRAELSEFSRTQEQIIPRFIDMSLYDAI